MPPAGYFLCRKESNQRRRLRGALNAALPRGKPPPLRTSPARAIGNAYRVAVRFGTSASWEVPANEGTDGGLVCICWDAAVRKIWLSQEPGAGLGYCA